MLNLSPTNLEDNGDTPEIIVESASEDDEIDISQFVESVLEEPAGSPENITVCPPLVYTTTPNSSKQQFQRPQLVGIAVTGGAVPSLTGIFPNPLHNVQYRPGPASRVGHHNRQNLGPQNSTAISNFTWLRDCFSKMKNSSLTLNYRVKCLEDRFKTINKDTDGKKILALASDLQGLLKQTELGYKYLGSELASAQQAYLQSRMQRIPIIRTNSNVLVTRQVLLPVSPDCKVASPVINAALNAGLALPPNMIISLNGSNHSLSITVENKTIDTAALCSKFNIKPCYVLLERCDGPKEADNDDIQIIEELIAL